MKKIFILSVVSCLSFGAVAQSPAPLANSGMSMLAVVRDAVLRYPAALAARSQVAGAVADLDKAEGARWPVFSIGTSSVQQVTDGSIVRAATPQVSYAIYAGGSIEASISRAQQLVRAAEGKASGALDDVALQAAEAYLMWARALEQKTLAQKNLAMIGQMTEEVRKIVAVDAGRAVDLSQAKVRLNAASLTLYQRDVELQQARARLVRYVGGELPAEPVGLDEWLFALPDSLDSAWATAIPTHPMLVQASAQLEAAREALIVARAQNWPRVDVSVSRQINSTTMQASTVRQLNLNMPVFNGGAGMAGVRVADAQVQAAQNALDEQELVVREKIGASWAEWSLAQQRASLNEDQAQAGQKLVESYQLQFRLARRSLLDLLNVQNDAYGYASAAVQMHYDSRLARFRLASAMGVLATAVKSTASN